MIKPEHFVEFAEEMSKDTASEFSGRMAMARAYYGVFHLLQAYAAEKGDNFDNSSGNTHALMRQYALSIPANECPDFIKRVRQYWDTLKLNRVTADYKINENIDRMAVELSVRNAKTIFSLYNDFKDAS